MTHDGEVLQASRLDTSELVVFPGDDGSGYVKLIRLPQIHDARGNLTFVEGGRHLPFDIERVYYLLSLIHI